MSFISLFGNKSEPEKPEPEEPEQAGHFASYRRVLDMIDPGFDDFDMIGQAVPAHVFQDCLETADHRLFLGFRDLGLRHKYL